MKYLQLIFCFVWTIAVQVMNIVFLIKFNEHRYQFFISFICGTMCIGALAANITEEDKNARSSNVRVPALLQILFFFLGMFLTFKLNR